MDATYGGQGVKARGAPHPGKSNRDAPARQWLPGRASRSLGSLLPGWSPLAGASVGSRRVCAGAAAAPGRGTRTLLGPPRATFPTSGPVPSVVQPGAGW